jgi:hypothetical protein
MPVAGEDRDRQHQQRYDPDPVRRHKRWNEKRNPVTLVATVVARKSAIQPLSRFAVRNPNKTRTPEQMPTRLSATCTMVSAVISIVLMTVPLVAASKTMRAEFFAP